MTSEFEPARAGAWTVRNMCAGRVILAVQTKYSRNIFSKFFHGHFVYLIADSTVYLQTLSRS
jgi:hypothetical protein